MNLVEEEDWEWFMGLVYMIKCSLRGSKGEAIMVEKGAVYCLDDKKVAKLFQLSKLQCTSFVANGYEERRRSIVIYMYNNDGH